MSDSSKRKERGGDGRDQRASKRSKRGNGGKWQTPHQKTKLFRGSGKIEPGDMGIWATCARSQEGRATEELKSMLEDCALRFYGLDFDIKEENDEEDSLEDIEALIQKEVAFMGKEQKDTKLFSAVNIDIPCVLFFKTRPPIDPVDFVYRICREVVSNPKVRRMRYVNRLTPVTLIGKATEKGLEEVTNAVLPPHFEMEGNQCEATEEGKVDEKQTGQRIPCPTYAIRPTTRNHSTLNRDIVIKQVASAVSKTHQVNLTAPDKTIIIEICQTVCGMSVVESDWETLKRFNLAELYNTHKKSTAKANHPIGEAKTEGVKTDELTVPPSILGTVPDSLEP